MTVLIRSFAPVLLALAVVIAGPVAASAKSLAERFSVAADTSNTTVDHSPWQKLLQTYVVPSEDGLNRVNYKQFKAEGADKLKSYIKTLEGVDVTGLTRDAQFAFWVNLYNAKTVDLILDHYPVKSIRDVRLTNFLIPGPWRSKVVTVNGQRLSLDDIEHEILRPLWKDPRIHYAVNCAAVGCPNLQNSAFTADSLEKLLDKGARDFVNNPRGVRQSSSGIRLSKIYSWFAVDFGDSDEKILAHLRRYAEPALAKKLAKGTPISGYDYNWNLNSK